MNSAAEDWVVDIENAVKSFAEKYATVYEKKERELSASFEIGCFHALTDFYEQKSSLKIKNLGSSKPTCAIASRRTIIAAPETASTGRVVVRSQSA